MQGSAGKEIYDVEFHGIFSVPCDPIFHILPDGPLTDR